jgi:hypothetical protein
METVVVDGIQLATGPFDELQVSWMDTILVLPPVGSGNCVEKTTKRPSSLIAGSELLPASAFPELSTETMIVEGAHPEGANVQVSRR